MRQGLILFAREVSLARAVSVHHVDLKVAVPRGHEGDVKAVGGPVGTRGGVVGKACWISSVGVY